MRGHLMPAVMAYALAKEMRRLAFAAGDKPDFSEQMIRKYAAAAEMSVAERSLAVG